MAQIYDFASRRALVTAQDTKANDQEKGVYIGNIGKSNAASFRSTLTVLESLAQKLSDLHAELEEVSNMHLTNTDYIVTMLKAENKFDMVTEELLVSEDGHVWIVDFPFPDEEE